MSAIAQLRRFWDSRRPTDEAAWDGDTSAWAVSLTAHLGVLVVLTLIGIVAPRRDQFLVVLSNVQPSDDPLLITEEFNSAETGPEAIGSAAQGDADAMLALTPTLAETTSLPAEMEVAEPEHATERIQIQEEIREATGPKFADSLLIKGVAGAGVSGAGGAIDRITQEILLSLEERKTLVVWFFDQSGSLERQRAEINKRFDRVYDELGVIEASGNPAFKQHDSKPLLSAVVAFGQAVSFPIAKPTDNVDEIKSAVEAIKTDDSGVEQTFRAVHDAAERFRAFRTQQPRRNVMFVIFTDEAGDDDAELDSAVAICRRFEIPVYCIGVPAPFGRRDALVKYVDPDPKYDQTPQWIPVRQGPESYLPELVRIGAPDEGFMDSGFGPYSLTRLCYETGGIFFAVHPNRSEGRAVGRRETEVSAAQLDYFFDPQVMLSYRPEYGTIKEYQKLLASNKARAALTQAAQMSRVSPMQRPQLYFPKTSDAELANRLSQAQRDAAILEPKVNQLYETLKQGEKDRPRLTKPRWQAGYDLSMGRVLALKVRTESYNAMLAKAKTGLTFKDAKSDTWVLKPADEITVGSALEKQAAEAKQYLERVVKEHPDTPWAKLAQSDLSQPMGWKWQESYTGVMERRQAMNNNNPRPPRDDRAKMLPRPERRPPPKL